MDQSQNQINYAQNAAGLANYNVDGPRIFFIPYIFNNGSNNYNRTNRLTDENNNNKTNNKTAVVRRASNSKLRATRRNATQTGLTPNQITWIVLGTIAGLILLGTVIFLIVYFVTLNKTANQPTNGCLTEGYVHYCNATGACISQKQLCDRYQDCPDDFDESNCFQCTTSQFKCKKGNKCVDQQFRCDGVSQCPDSSDESSCLSLSAPSNITKAQFNGSVGYDYYICACGSRPLNSSLPYSSYIINGLAASAGAWPWLGLFETATSLCGATLINHNWALTAAHCVLDTQGTIKTGTTTVTFGSTLLDYKTDPQAESYVVESFLVHPEYTGSTGNDIVADFALMKLARSVVYTNFIAPVCLPGPNDNNNLDLKYKVCASIGFGNTNKGQTSTRLLQSRMNIKSDAQCISLLTTYDNPTSYLKKLCIGSDPGYMLNNICFGDSGGPLSCKGENNLWYLVGVHSYVFPKSTSNYGNGDVRNCEVSVAARELTLFKCPVVYHILNANGANVVSFVLEYAMQWLKCGDIQQVTQGLHKCDSFLSPTEE
ncbi:hypothetical protein HELRODRAFT_176328 [Helobdella robusta]|uniref:Peptidase S1 domain-containing protein n=1 Tax=Helobdella robusta TaxID=6412 RepID=T1FAE3_HELRO|nr:hypothetical protein HELRODRAFT_176328 [Helobdella robusta]ESO00024.1 hypothetical protein HELRODRAFT_176328 [Helobdella robusta]